jgi:hypothetical protein
LQSVGTSGTRRTDHSSSPLSPSETGPRATAPSYLSSVSCGSSFKDSPESSSSSGDSSLEDYPEEAKSEPSFLSSRTRQLSQLSKFNVKLFPDPDTDAEATPSTPLLQDHVSQKPGKFVLHNRGSKKNKKPK